MRARRILSMSVVVGAMVATFFHSGAASASGGGGCGAPVTDRRGDRVVIKDFCFGPTILRVHRGEDVTFTNRDRGVPHTVLGANASWGSFRTLGEKRMAVTYRFTETGVYPYVCTWHPGMIGAVVVGGGPRMPSGMTTTAQGPVVKVDPTELQAVSSTVPVPELVPTDAETAWPAAALGLAAAGALGLVIRNRRTARIAAV